MNASPEKSLTPDRQKPRSRFIAFLIKLVAVFGLMVLLLLFVGIFAQGADWWSPGMRSKTPPP